MSKAVNLWRESLLGRALTLGPWGCVNQWRQWESFRGRGECDAAVRHGRRFGSIFSTV